MPRKHRKPSAPQKQPSMSGRDERSESAAEYRRHFDQYYLAVIPRLLNDEGLFLAFVAMLSAVEALAGAFAPERGTGERFRAFVSRYFPETYRPHVNALWEVRNKLVHSFNPGPMMILCHNSRMHLSAASGVYMLNAEDFYADMLAASRRYFQELYADEQLQRNFTKRLADSGDGGGPTTCQVNESL